MPRPAAAVNRLLRGLPDRDRRRILAGCETVDLAFADVLCTPGDRIGHVYFPTRSFISLIMPIDDSASLEVGMVGNEGMFGIPLVLGVDVSPVGAVVLGGGAALRMDAAGFSREFGRSPALHHAIDCYVFVHLSQLAQTAACTRFHVVEARLARWLLMTQDRVGPEFAMTQEYLAQMLGTGRPSLSLTASQMQRVGAIQYTRGLMRVLDRAELEKLSCECYSVVRTMMADLELG